MIARGPRVIGDDPLDGVVPSGSVDEAARNYKKAKVNLLGGGAASHYSVEVPSATTGRGRRGRDELHDPPAPRRADERTKVMTCEEYVIYSGYRQTSFTWHNGKRFREWASSGEGKTPIEPSPHPGGLS
ncbi:hypothetical protein HRG_007116 [Hirsutella rhossiliensis]|uniref:Uncharacterized protein n=1 Tax=Hirsutella rhossiliensis TaxID=111463 RepID=A0A9P8MXE8_9HYPO|nr:uncharacterized protein HRG_07116 [Hirsutella rhossiliensis]KAH0962036.1 hypothetical protein HRG_07116 [Hirsutella rhossiliensis]